MTAPSSTALDGDTRLAHLPLALFAAPMGVGGLGLAWREAHRQLGAPAAAGEALLVVAGLLWLLLAVLHAVRALRHPDVVRADLEHPVRSAYTGAIGIGLLIVCGALLPYSAAVARPLWLLAVVLQTLAGLWIMRVLLRTPRDAAALTPALLIPMVGSIVAPIPGVGLGFVALSWMLFGAGAMLWAVLQPLLIGRLASGPELPLRLRPSLVILLAPPAVGSLALWQLTGGFGPAPTALLGFAVLVALVLASLWREILAAPFSLAWWAVTFPAAAFTTALLVYFRHVPASWSPALLWPMLIGLTAVVATVAIRTLRAATAGQLLRPEA